jgi:hypothetical protein
MTYDLNIHIRLCLWIDDSVRESRIPVDDALHDIVELFWMWKQVMLVREAQQIFDVDGSNFHVYVKRDSLLSH